LGIVSAITEWYKKHKDLAGVALVAVIAHLGYGVLNQSAIPPYVAITGWTPYIGGIYAAWLLAETIAKAPMGALADLIGMRAVYVIASAVGAVSAFLWTITGILGVIFAIRVADGFASAGAWTVTVLAMGGTVRSQARTGAMGLFLVTYLIGLAFAPLVGGYANDITGSKLTSFYVASVFFAIAAMLALFLVPVHPRSEEGPDQERIEHRSLLAEIWLGVKAFPEYMVVAFAAFFSIGTLIPVMKLFAMQELGLTETEYGFLVLPVAGVLTVAALLAGKISDLIGKYRTVQGGVALSAIAMYLVPWIHKPWELAVLATIIGIGFAVGMPAWLALISDMSAPDVRGSVIGAVGTGQGIGLLLGVLLGGYLYTLHPIHVLGITVRTHYAQFWISAFGLSLCVALTLLSIREGLGRYITADMRP
jgi:MFS family permease